MKHRCRSTRTESALLFAFLLWGKSPETQSDPSSPGTESAQLQICEGGEIRSGKDRFTGPRFYSGTVPFAHSVANWKSSNPVVAFHAKI